jgi:hypothetical protein
VWAATVSSKTISAEIKTGDDKNLFKHKTLPTYIAARSDVVT